MLATSPDFSIPFPETGSRAYRKVSGDPVTILRRNADGSALIRRDARPGQGRFRDASGNTTLPLTDLFASEQEALAAGLPRPRRRRARGA